MKRFAVLALLAVSMTVFGQTKKVCFTIDDLPVVHYGMSDSSFQKALTQKLVGALHAQHIPAIGFVNEQRLYSHGELDPSQVGLLRIWLDAGLELGNHTFSHPDYNRTSYADFTANIVQGETVTKRLLAEKGKPLRYFRHPFLHVGNNRAKADSLDAFLASNGYTVAPVTIDNDDYLFALAYKRAKDKNDTAAMALIGHDYVDYMERKLLYFEQQAQRLLGRPIHQILLMHASLLNADYANALAAMFVRNNYRFVSLDEALEDEAYRLPITKFGNWGISWIDRWALSQGMTGDFFKDEPPTPDYIVELAK